mmetsp:Transcript_12656/g.37943  ORF Transcript_12656/g.37943 Transcript_12656/m.37943 type:complete len:194 (-) Transcript_12656:426-1007(-)
MFGREIGSQEEKTPLTGGSGGGSGSGFYFLPKVTASTQADVEEEDRPVHDGVAAQEGGGGFFGFLGFGSSAPRRPKAVKLRKVPVKVEPKVFFSNERTFLAWLHMSVTLASISIAIIAFADHNEWSQLYGLLLLPVAIAFSVYSLYIYQRRASMIRRRDPGPYEDRVGPILLATILMVSIILQFAVKMYHLAA